jgi:PAS domain S-box-containing protein
MQKTTESKPQEPAHKESIDDPRTTLKHFFDIMVPSGLIFGGIALSVSVFRSVQQGWNRIVMVHVILYVIALIALQFRKHFSVYVLLSVMIGLMAIPMVHSLWTMGFAGEGMILLTALCFLSGIFLKIRTSVLVSISGLLVVSIIGAGICTGKIELTTDWNQYLYDPASWILQVSLVLLFVIPLVLIIAYTREKMIHSIFSLKESNKHLVEEIETRKQMEKELFESELKYRGVVENSLAAFYIEQNQIIRFVNKQFCEITGFAPEEIVNHLGIADLLESGLAEETSEKISKAILHEKKQKEFELNLKRKDGKLITAKLYAHAFPYEQKEAVFGTFIDITTEKHMENRLRQSQKMEAIGALTSGIIHDFSNIITSLSGYGALLKMEMEAANPLVNYVDNILSATDKATELTKSLLTYTRFQATTLKPVLLNSVIRQSKGLLKRLISEKIVLKDELSSDELTVLADVTQLDQILFNLVANAGDAMPDGGTLTIRTELGKIDDPFIAKHGFGKIGSFSWLMVSDTGSGIDEKNMGNIFDPFFTTKEIGKGTGLGLSTVYGIVKQHNGYIFAESEVGKGTSFHIYLPVIPERFLHGIQTMNA